MSSITAIRTARPRRRPLLLRAFRAGCQVPFGYWRRRKLAVALLSLIQIPAILWTSLASPATSIILLGTLVVWLVRITRSRALRGWSVRIPAEVVADLLRIVVPLLCLQFLLIRGVLDLPVLLPLAVQIGTFSALTLQALFWRGRPATWVRILGSPSHLGAAVGTFEQCMDLLGRDGCRFAPFRADKPEPTTWRRRMHGWLERGETVLVLEPQLRALAGKLRQKGDVIFAEDCLLFTSMTRPAGRLTDFTLSVLNQILALISLFTLWPLGLGLALMIKLDDGGPIIFTQERVGRAGRLFRLYKFRTMRFDSAPYASHPGSNDPRVTRIGRWLRRLSLDELPQIINVLAGDMRLVGPRPEMRFIVDAYTARQRQRLEVTPGITGLWQVSPHRNDPIHHHIEYDLAYIAHRGPILDLALIIATLGLANSSGR